MSINQILVKSIILEYFENEHYNLEAITELIKDYTFKDFYNYILAICCHCDELELKYINKYYN